MASNHPIPRIWHLSFNIGRSLNCMILSQTGQILLFEIAWHFATQETSKCPSNFLLSLFLLHLLGDQNPSVLLFPVPQWASGCHSFSQVLNTQTWHYGWATEVQAHLGIWPPRNYYLHIPWGWQCFRRHIHSRCSYWIVLFNWFVFQLLYKWNTGPFSLYVC